MTKRDTFLDRNQVIHILMSAFADWDPSYKIKLITPAVIKPRKLWTGKQVVGIFF